MQAAIVTVPLALMRQTEVVWDIDWRGSPAQESVGGIDRSVQNAFPRWIGQPQLRLGRALLGRWRALRWQAEGRVNLWRLPMFDPAMFNPRLLPDGPALLEDGIPFSTGARFSTGEGFEYIPTVPAAETASVGATTLRVSVDDPAFVPRPGQILSHDDWPFGVTAVEAEGGDAYRLHVQPGLRGAIAAGDPVRLVATGLFRLTSDDSGRIAYGPELLAEPSFSFSEFLNR